MTAFRSAYIYVKNTFIGILSETDDGYSFKYDANYLKSEKPLPISLTMPLQSEVPVFRI